MSFRKKLRTGLLLALVSSGVLTAFNSGQCADERGDRDRGFAAVLQSVEKSNGNLTPAIRSSFVDWAERTVSDQLAEAKITVPADCWIEVRSDPTLRDAMFGAVYPPDPSILENYARLRSTLGTPYLNRYRSLVMAAAVARRTKGVSTDDDSAPQKIKKQKRPDYFEDLDAELQPEEADEDVQLVHAIADFMKTNRISALALYQNETKQQELFQFLKVKGVDSDLIRRTDKRLAPALMGAMIVLGQRPASREPEPDLATWLRYVAAVYQTTPASTPTVGKKKDKEAMPWPLFPVDRSPWPLLMSLSQPMPLGEARYIWETFQGAHGPKRYHDYGPYRSRATARLYELQPSPWHWDSWPDRIVHGGVCVVMATIALDTHHALAEPAVHAGQPHHANLIAYHNTGGAWVAVIEQAFAGGPPVTHAAWLFKDDVDTAPRLMTPNRCGSEYHLGLAAGMNVGLKQYIDTRIAVTLFNALPDEKKKTIGVSLLNQAIQTNPFNPAVWYRFAEQDPVAARNLLAAKAAPASTASKSVKKRANREAGAILERDNPEIAEIQTERYWDTVGQLLTNPDSGAAKKAGNGSERKRNR